jgi:predicted transcriptional regulator
MIDKEPTMNKIKKSLENPINQRIIQHLSSNGRLNFSHIIKNLSLNHKTGILHIVELKNLGLIKYVNNSHLELNQDLLQSLKE